MTTPHNSPALLAGNVESAVDLLRERGLRLSSARRLVLEALYAVDRPLTADEIAAGVGGRVPRSDLASVYRNLETLEAHGLVRHMHLGHSPGLYLRTDAEHEFAVCERCGDLQTLDPALLDEVRAAVRAAVGLHARFSHFPLTGLCGDCAAKDGEDEDPSRSTPMPRKAAHAHP